jgi:hypothetical protein
LFWLQASRIIRKALVVFPLRNATSAFSHSPLTPAEPANSPAPLSPHKLKSPPPPPLAGSKGVFVLLPLQLTSPLAPALLPFELNKPAANNRRGWTQPFCFKFSTCQTSQSTKEKKRKTTEHRFVQKKILSLCTKSKEDQKNPPNPNFTNGYIASYYTQSAWQAIRHKNQNLQNLQNKLLISFTCFSTI